MLSLLTAQSEIENEMQLVSNLTVTSELTVRYIWLSIGISEGLESPF